MYIDKITTSCLSVRLPVRRSDVQVYESSRTKSTEKLTHTMNIVHEQGRIHDNPCRGQLGRGGNDLGRGSDDFGRGMLKYKLSYP